MIKKSLHYDWRGTSAYLQDIDYRYNIRGWLTNINNSQLINDGGVTNSDDFDAFGESIFYNSSSSGELNSDPSIIQATSQFNGNIAAIKWKVKSPYLIPTKAVEHLYTYRYDDLNRMTAGYFATDESLSGFINSRDNVKNFDEIVNYDFMGNITKLNRNSMLGDLDRLDYEYDGNRLINVVDNGTVHSDFDFHDQSNSVDYIYRKNGSLEQDKNRNLNITYHSIGLPNKVENFGKNLDYIYSGTGEKLKKSTQDNNTFYVYGIEYSETISDGLGPKFAFIQTEEGRIRFRKSNAIYPDANRKFVFDYFLKDHLGSVRAILTEEEVSTRYHATMEQINSGIERAIFKNVDETRQDKPVNEPIDQAYNPDLKVSQLATSSVKESWFYWRRYWHWSSLWRSLGCNWRSCD